jgi:transcriptional regulator with XRE-family HTH domain
VTVAEKVEWLIQNMWPVDQPPPKTNVDTAKAISSATGEEMSHASIWKLRTGRTDNPTLKTLKALRAFFKIPSIGYFDDGEAAESVDDQVTLLALLRKGIGLDVLRRLAELSPDNREMVVGMIDTVARREQRGREDSTPDSREA